jgi:excisionase family DNA binding protein
MDPQVVETRTMRTANATLKQAAAFLQVCDKTVLNLADRKVLKPVRIGRRRFFRWSELEQLAKHGTR